MLDICFTTSIELGLSFNCLKSHCICFGSQFKYKLSYMCIGDEKIEWSKSITYLGIRVCGGKTLTSDIAPVKQAFFSACNCIYASAKHNDEIVHLSLQETYCKPVLTYGMTALSLTSEQARSLNCCWNSVYRKIFGFNKWDSVSSLIYGLGRLNLHHDLLLLRVKFYKHLLETNSTVMTIVLREYCLAFCMDIALRLSQLSYSVAKSYIYRAFKRKIDL